VISKILKLSKKKLKQSFSHFFQIIQPPIPSANEVSAKKILGVNLSASDVVLDCGANIGSITGILAKAGTTVYAFEPNPYAYALLQRTFRFYRNVHCYQQAVGDKNEMTRLYFHKFSDEDPIKWSVGSSLISNKANIDAHHSIEVQVIDLAQFVRSIGRRVRLIKMDIEGVEYRTLIHLIETNTIDLVDDIFVESHHERHPMFRSEYERLIKLIAERQITNIHMDWV
jgi:FkbM family methyltransferase